MRKISFPNLWLQLGAVGTKCLTWHCLHADIVEIKHIMLPPSPREFKDIYVVFELMETDLHQVSFRSDRRDPW